MYRRTKKFLAGVVLALCGATWPAGAARAQDAEPRVVTEATAKVVASDAAPSTKNARAGESKTNEPAAPRWGSVPPAPASQQPGAQTTATPVVAAPSANAPVQQTPQGPPAPASPAQPPTATPTLTTQQAQQSQTGGAATQPQAPPAPAPWSQLQGPSVQATQGVAPQQGAPAQVVPPPSGVRPPGRESVPSAAPAEVDLNVPPVASDFRAPESPLPALERVGVETGEQRPLTLREAIEMALANNKDIEVARQNARAAEFDLEGARGVYDPRLGSFSYYEKSEQPAASFLSGGTSGSVTQSGFFNTATFQGLTPKAGGGYRVDFTSNRVTTNNQFAALNPQYPSALTFSYTQPLLRGRGFDANRRAIEIARRNLSLTDAQFRQRAVETITNVQRAYWDLVFALRNLQIQRDAVRDARAQLEHNRRLVAEGQLAPVDVVAAEAQVSGFEQSVYSALEDVSRAENSLKNLIAETRRSPFWNVAVVPVDQVRVEPPAVTLAEAFAAALANRQELKSSDVAREINEIEQRFAREQARPQADLVGSYGVVGLAGSLSADAANNPFTASNALLRERINELSRINGLAPLPEQPAQNFPENLVGGYPQSLANLAANRYNNFRVGVQLNLPLRNRTAGAQLGRALVEGERLATQREQLEQLIQVDVRNALQGVKTAESRLRAAATARAASEQQYMSEQRKFDVGQSTVFLVLERQTALATARGNELRAQTELNKSIAELQRATGNALEANQVQVSVR